MTHDELKKAAIDYLVKAFNGSPADASVIQAAVAIALAPKPAESR